MRERRFIQCDVFTSTPTLGNGLAVVVDGDGLTDAEMQRFAAWTNLAETTFLLPPTDPAADYRVRIFTTVREMLFAGHPTLGSCAAWLKTGGQPKTPGVVRQECGVGIVEIDMAGAVPAFIAPPTEIAPMDDLEFHRICQALEIAPATVRNRARLENGPVWQVLELSDADAVLAAESSRLRWPEFQAVGLIGAHGSGHECDYEVRMLAPSSGMSEDPITGSLNSALSHWLHGMGRLGQDLLVAQGTSIGRQGRVYMRPDRENSGTVRIGGETQMLIEGTVIL